MLSFLITLAFAAAVYSQVIPTAPGPGEVYRTGSDCPIQWKVDDTETWTDMTIDLMSGSNLVMDLVTNVVTGIDGTDASLTPFKWICPEVTPNSNIYFYQFSLGPKKMNATWTTRFTIASRDGSSTPPPNESQPNGDPAPWGKGRLMSEANSTADSSPIVNRTEHTGKEEGQPQPVLTHNTGTEDPSEDDAISSTVSATRTAHSIAVDPSGSSLSSRLAFTTSPKRVSAATDFTPSAPSARASQLALSNDGVRKDKSARTLRALFLMSIALGIM